MDTYLVTGGAGFIGCHLVRGLLKLPAKVRVIDNLSTGRIENLADVLDKIEFIHGDITDFPLIKKSVEGVKIVFHQAAIASVARSVDDPLPTNQANVEGTLKLLIASKGASVKRIVFAASSSAYGDADKFPEEESFKPDPMSPYAASKVAGEMYGKIFNNIFGVEFVSLRYFNVFGPFQNPHSEYAAVIPKFITCMLEGKRPPVFGTGKQARDFCYVDNVVSANILASTAEKAPGSVYNIGSFHPVNLLTLIQKLNKLLGTSYEPEFLSARAGDPFLSHASIERAKQDLGYSVLVDFDEGLKKTLDYYKSI
jgi:UDP-glucose 4-epimerase